MVLNGPKWFSVFPFLGINFCLQKKLLPRALPSPTLEGRNSKVYIHVHVNRCEFIPILLFLAQERFWALTRDSSSRFPFTPCSFSQLWPLFLLQYGSLAPLKSSFSSEKVAPSSVFPLRGLRTASPLIGERFLPVRGLSCHPRRGSFAALTKPSFLFPFPGGSVSVSKCSATPRDRGWEEGRREGPLGRGTRATSASRWRLPACSWKCARSIYLALSKICCENIRVIQS